MDRLEAMSIVLLTVEKGSMPRRRITDVEAVRAADYTDAQIVNIVAETAFSFITHLFNATDLDAFPSASHMFRDLIPELAGRYHVVAPDLPGFGMTEQPARDASTTVSRTSQT